jgi:cell division septum initiation protein DivIVA
VQEGIKESQRLVSQTEVVQSAHAESSRLIDAAHAEADRLRGECDIYVDSKLAEFEDYLNGTLRSVGRGRHQLRTAAGTHDYVQR